LAVSRLAPSQFLTLLPVVLLSSGLALLGAGCSSDNSTKPLPDKHVAGANCGGCHTQEHGNWAMSLHAASPSDVLLNSTHNAEELLMDECVGCHSPFQAVAYHIGDFVQPVDQTGPWHLVESNVNKWQAIKCEVCHDPTSSKPKKLAFHDPATQQYVQVATSTELCEKCHQPGTDDSRDLAGSVHQGRQCADCHLQPGTHMNIDPHNSCVSCHPQANPQHPDVTTLDTTYRSLESPNNIHFVTCTTCHNPVPSPGRS
jgi:hypothetical protein